MGYRTDNKHSVSFVFKRATNAVMQPIRGVAEFMRSVREDIRTSEREDFDFFFPRTLDPERTRSIFA